MQYSSTTASWQAPSVGSQHADSSIANVFADVKYKVRVNLNVSLVFSLFSNLLALAIPLFTLLVYDRVITSGHYETLAALFVMAFTALAVAGLLDWLRGKLAARTASWLDDTLAPVALRLSFERGGAGQDAAEHDVQHLRDLTTLRTFLASHALSNLFDLPWAFIFIALVCVLHPHLGILVCFGAAVLLLLSALNAQFTRSRLHDQSVRQRQSHVAAAHLVANSDAIMAMGMTDDVVRNWHPGQRSAVAAAEGLAMMSSTLMVVSRTFRSILQIAIVALGAHLVLANELTAGALVAALILLSRALSPLEAWASSWHVVSMARLALRRFEGSIAKLADERPKLQLPRPRGNVTVSQLSLALGGRGSLLLDRISLEINPGDVVAITGPSGAGKSTLMRVIAGLVPPTYGEVRIDGARLNEWDSERLGRFVGFVSQEARLFNGSVRDNIARFEHGADDAVLAAARLAGAHDMILSLADGYDTVLGAGGAHLSAGQQQLIAIARAAYRNPPILLLDEPNANLDQAGEQRLIDLLRCMSANGSAVVIAGHRPSTLTAANKIAVMRHGRLAAFGEKEQIMRQLRGGSKVQDLSAGTADASRTSMTKE